MGFVSKKLFDWEKAVGGTTYTVIRKIEAKDVGQVEDDLVFRVINLRSSDVCLDAIDLFKRPFSRTGVGVRMDRIHVWNLPSAVPS